VCDCVSSVLNFGAAGAADRGNKRNGARCKKSTCSRGCYFIKKITSCRLNEAQIITLVSKKEHAVKKSWVVMRGCICTQFSFAWSIFCHDTHANLR
jgi:hypothetical protein